MNPAGETQIMQVTVTVSDAIVREAAAHSTSIVEFVESLIDKGRVSACEPVGLDSAIDRIRRLRASSSTSGR
jgi:hypothetical protein